jgi:hypothetical protein
LSKQPPKFEPDDAAELPCAPVQDIERVLNDPQVEAGGMLIEQDHPVLGKVSCRTCRSRFPVATAARPFRRRWWLAQSPGRGQPWVIRWKGGGNGAQKVLYAEDAVASLK